MDVKKQPMDELDDDDEGWDEKEALLEDCQPGSLRYAWKERRDTRDRLEQLGFSGADVVVF